MTEKNNLSHYNPFDDVDVYKLAELKYGAKENLTFPGNQLTHMNDFNNFCMNTVAEFVDPEVLPIRHSGAGQKCQTAMLQQLMINGKTLKAGNKLRMPVVLSRPQYFKDALIATGNPDEAYKICCNSCVVNSSDNTIHQSTCIERCGDALNTIKLTDPKNLPKGIKRSSVNVTQQPPEFAASYSQESQPPNGHKLGNYLTSAAADNLEANSDKQKAANYATNSSGPAYRFGGRSAYNPTSEFTNLKGKTNVNTSTDCSPREPKLNTENFRTKENMEDKKPAKQPNRQSKDPDEENDSRPGQYQEGTGGCWLIIFIIFIVTIILMLVGGMSSNDEELAGSSLVKPAFNFNLGKKRKGKKLGFR